MNKKIKVSFFLLTALVLLSGCFKKDQDTFTVALSSDYPPFEFQQDGKIVGFDVDLANVVANKLGKTLVIQDMPFFSLLGALQSGKADAVLAGLAKTEERAKLVDFSEPYYESKMAVLYDVTKVKIYSVADLNGKIVGVQTGSVSETFLKSDSSFSDVTVFSQDNNNQLVEHLKIGRIDAILIGLEQVIEFAKSSADFSYVSLDENYAGCDALSIAMPKGNHELLEKVNSIIAEMQQDGTLKELQEKWIPVIKNQPNATNVIENPGQAPGSNLKNEGDAVDDAPASTAKLLEEDVNATAAKEATKSDDEIAVDMDLDPDVSDTSSEEDDEKDEETML